MSMKSRLLLMLLSCSLSPAATLTVNFDVRENFQPSRRANLSISDGLNSFGIDLFHAGLLLFGNPLSACDNFGVNPSPCMFTPGGVLNATNIFATSAFSSLVLNGVEVPFPDRTDYAITFFMNFTGGNAITVPVGTPWGPQALNSELNIAVMQISTGLCLFCESASGTGTASGQGFFDRDWPNYTARYQASGGI